MFSYLKVLLIMGLLGGFLSVHAQVGTVKGKLTYPDGTPASFAVVKCRNTALETLANDKGEFELSNLRRGEHHLEVQTIGHRQFFPTLKITSDTIIIHNQELSFSPQYLDEVVITGNAEPQTIRQSIYQVRSISEEQIKMRGASNIGTLLNTELGIRFSNDLALGTSDIELMGLSGQNVKILLNGIPLLDRGESRESLNQIDINTITKIEIVEGPMSVIYGTDALAGVINIITKNNTTTNDWGITAKVQEETANNEYSLLHKEGLHNVSVQAYRNWNNWQIGAGTSRNTFGGWQGTSTGRAKAWMPKEQLLANGHIGYNTSKMQLRYRFNGTDEDLNYLGNIIGSNYSDKRYTTWRLFHQLEGQYHFTESTNLSVSSSYTDYSRKTLSTNTDIITNKTTLSLEEGSQDRNTFQSIFGRATLSHKTNPTINWVAGLEYNYNKAAGARIEGTPSIADYAAFVIPEIKLWNGKFKLKPGARFIYNTVYNAPPIIPSINTKWFITPKLDLRMAYAKGFRAPSLRELYFSFYDASHAMHGNTNLKAESSNSVNSFLNYSVIQRKNLRITSSIGIFFNAIQNRIDLAVDPQNTSEYSYFNIDRLKTKGANWNSHLIYKTLQTSVGVQWIGLSNPFNRNDIQNLKAFTWTPEFTLTNTYLIPSIKTTFFLAWKLTGKRPGYEQISNGEIRATEIASYNMADFSLIRPLGKLVQFNAGVRNIFDVTNIRNSSSTEGTHSTGGDRPISYGRSYFIGLQVNFKKNT